MFHFKKDVPKIKFISIDVTNGCNLKCPFCMTIHPRQAKPDMMTMDCFKKVVGLLPYVDGDSFWLSCLCEPFLHKEFMKLIDIIPPKDRNKVWFTTNLSIHISDDVISQLANSRLHHINISVDTFDRNVYACLRRGGNFDTFMDNLYRLSKTFSGRANSPRINFITMALKSNINEIRSINHLASTKYGVSHHEVRCVFGLKHIGQEWIKDNVLGLPEVPLIEEALRDSSISTFIYAPPSEDYYQQSDPYYDQWNYTIPDRPYPRSELKPFTKPLQIRIFHDGTLRILADYNEFCHGSWPVDIHINQIDNISKYLAAF